LAVQAASDRKPLATVKVRLKGGDDITLSLLQREPQWVLARSDRKFEYQLPGAIAQRLLAPPVADNAK
jgi:CYTH domain-containing protein